VGPLISLLGDDYALVRGHAAWALGKIQVGDAQKALVQARAKESNETVSAELSLALAVVGGS
jgi:epoxyqueuosine reductase